jgi:initiation factor 1A
MPKNKFGGKKAKKGGNKKTGLSSRGLRYKDADDQEYAKIGKALGTGRFLVTIFSDDSEKMGVVCGSLYKRVWMRDGDVVLISYRSCNTAQDHGKQVDIIHKYNPEEAKTLERNGDLKKAIEEAKETTAIGITFEGDNEDNENEDEDLGDFLMGV